MSGLSPFPWVPSPIVESGQGDPLDIDAFEAMASGDTDIEEFLEESRAPGSAGTIPASAFIDDIENKIRMSGPTPSQEALDAWLETRSDAAYLQTESRKGTDYHSAANINTLYDEDSDIYTYPDGKTWGDLAGRASYSKGGTPPGGTGGEAATLPADFLGSPWKMPEVLKEQFKLEPVLRAGFLPSIRPGDVGGIVHHPNRRATLRVMNQDGTCVYATTNFMLEGVQRLVEEDYRPAQGFEENLLQLYGEKFKLYSFSIKMLDSANLDWQRAWDQAWRKHIRGSVLAANHNRCYILVGTKLYGGYPLKYTDQTSAAQEPVKSMSMVMFITDDEPLPTMVRLVNKQGMEYFKWVPKSGESIFSSDSIHLAKDLPEYADEVIAAESFAEAEYEAPQPQGPPE